MKLLGSALNFLKTPFMFFLVGFVFWFVQFRIIKVKSLGDEQKKTSYALVYLSSVKKGDQAVFHYPNVESQVHVDKILSFDPAKGHAIATNSHVFVKNELVLGRVFYTFKL